MVCHETYKNQQNEWLTPEEVISEDGKKFYKKTNILTNYFNVIFFYLFLIVNIYLFITKITLIF